MSDALASSGSAATNNTGGFDLGPLGTFNPGNILGDITGNAVLILPPRQIGMLIPHVVIEENHRDDLVITEHPVEQGASITDHAFKRPPEVAIRAGWSNSGYGEGFVQVVYDALLALQASRVPFGVVTGKRAYASMLIRSLGVTTDQASEKALFVTVALQQIVIVQTQETTVAPTSAQASPDKTGGVQQQGQVQGVPVAGPQQSLLLKAANGLGLGASTNVPLTNPTVSITSGVAAGQG